MIQGRKVQAEEADKLIRRAGLLTHEGPYGPLEWAALDQALRPDYRLRIWSKEHCNEPAYEAESGERRIELYLYENHYAVITRIAPYLNRSYYCDICDCSYNNQAVHRCVSGCYFCRQPKPCKRTTSVFCKVCRFYFPSQSCFDHHKLEVDGNGTKRLRKESICSRFKRCEKCGIQIDKSQIHRCNQYKCRSCKQYVTKGEENHQLNCYMQPLRETNEDTKTEQKPQIFIFFDFEASQTRILKHDKNGNPVYAHDPNLCVVNTTCDLCKSDADVWIAKTKNCDNCGTNHQRFEGVNCLNDFASWLFSGQNAGRIALAHNGKGYDTQFLLR